MNLKQNTNYLRKDPFYLRRSHLYLKNINYMHFPLIKTSEKYIG